MYVYLDNNSTTPCAPEVLAKMLPYFAEEYANAASPHEAGRAASSAITAARQQVADAMGTKPECVIFTGSATESNNLAILGVANKRHSRRKLVVSAVEHKSVLEPAFHLRQHGYAVEIIPVDRNGVVDLYEAGKLIDDQTLIVSIQGANNETGVIQPIRQIVQLAHDRGALCHSDAAQILGKVPVNIEELGVDIACFSAHKMYGPKGIGALFVAPHMTGTISPISFGGHQERGLRPGTQNVPAIVGFGCACQVARDLVRSDAKRINLLREKLESDLLTTIPESRVNASNVTRLPGTISLTIPGTPADMLIANLPTVCISNGSACNSGALEPSHVLLAMNFSRAEAESTLRISLGRYTTEKDVVMASREIADASCRLRTQLNRSGNRALSTGGHT
ncbi:MAG: cysteine desulfurase family protein [bacterium]